MPRGTYSARDFGTTPSRCGHGLDGAIGYQGERLAETPAIAPYSDKNPPRSGIKAIQADRSTRLWILIDELRDDWRENMEEVPGSRGINLRLTHGDAGIFSTRIDVLDLTTGTIIGRTRSEHMSAFMGEGLILQNRRTDDGFPEIVIWSFGWKES